MPAPDRGPSPAGDTRSPQDIWRKPNLQGCKVAFLWRPLPAAGRVPWGTVLGSLAPDVSARGGAGCTPGPRLGDPLTRPLQMRGTNTNGDWIYPASREDRKTLCLLGWASCPRGCRGEPAPVTGEEVTEPSLGGAATFGPASRGLWGPCWAARGAHPGCYVVRTRPPGLGQRGARSSSLYRPRSLHRPGDPPMLGQPPPEQWAPVRGAWATGTGATGRA